MSQTIKIFAIIWLTYLLLGGAMWVYAVYSNELKELKKWLNQGETN